jgi:heme-degrading monooxygenase HmoA
MFTVMVRFSVTSTPEEIESNVVRLVSNIVRHQPGFRQSLIHRRDDASEVVNAMVWDDRASFDGFRARHKDDVAAAVGRFGPQFSFYDVLEQILPPSSEAATS